MFSNRVGGGAMRVLQRVLLKGSIYVGSSKEDPEVRSRKGVLIEYNLYEYRVPSSGFYFLDTPGGSGIRVLGYCQDLKGGSRTGSMLSARVL